jgi:hypothetical protein
MKPAITSLALALWLAAPALLSAQSEQLPDDVGFISTVGTTAQVDGAHWAYLLWQSSEDGLAADRSFALYRRDTPLGLFQRISVTRDQGDERVIQALIPRAVKLGQDVNALSDSLRLIFQDLVPDPALSVAARLSAVIRGTRGNAEQRGSLAFVARSHPLVAMALGQALADPLPGAGEFTYELREFDTAAAQDIRVLGRVTLNTAAAASLPAPGRPYDMLLPDARVKEGHLALHLRWSTPNALRELAPKHSGFRVYRVNRAFAEDAARKWQNTPPTPAVLVAAAHATPDQVWQVNEAPIYPEQLLDDGAGPGGAENPADRTTYFFTDDNDRFDDGAQPLPNGAQYYYFATALDILGRDGLVSPGRLTTVCDRMSPPAPLHARVTPEVSYADGQPLQQFAVRWAPVVDTDSSVTSYHLYRWTSLEELQEHGNDPLVNRIAILPHAPGAEEYRFLDTTVGAPRFPPAPGQPDVSGMPFLYTVRALDAGACGSNASPHSAPSRGTLRDPQGPAAPVTQVMIQCHEPVVTYTSAALKAEAGLADNAHHLRLVCATPYPETFAWAEFRFDYGGTFESSPAGRVYFGDGGTASQLAAMLASLEIFPSQILCRAALRSGRVSAWAPATVSAPDKARDQRYEIVFTATLNTSVVETGGPCGSSHSGIEPGTGETAPICVNFIPAPGSREIKIYRRVEGGPLTLVAVREVGPPLAPLQWCDGDLPAAIADVDYFLQAFDENGNPSPLAPAGDTVRVGVQKLMPVPMLLPPEHLAANKARLRWSCAPHGIERFELWIAKKRGTPPAAWAGSLLSDNLGNVRPLRHPDAPSLDFGVYQTGVVTGLPTTDDGAVFYVDIPVQPQVQYHILVRAVDRGSYAGGRLTGDFSNMQEFQWNSGEVTPGVQVPWPARDMPPPAAAAQFHPLVSATYLPHLVNPGDWQGVGIRIGQFDYAGGNSTLVKGSNPGPTGNPEYYLKDHVDPRTLLYKRAAAAAADEEPDTLLPCIIYRMQVTSAVPQTVISGDTSQASPLIETIAHVHGAAGPDQITVVHDPFIGIKITGAQIGIHGEIFLLDRNPVISGASYAYLLVRFAKDGEIQEVLSTNTVAIP